MAVAKITRQGLTSIAILVAILWGCLLAERYLTRTSQMETYRALRQIRYLKFKRHLEPAAQPAPASSSHTLGPVIG
jgi:hypothetical protein